MSIRAGAFIRQAEAQPGKLALGYEDRSWTYGALLRNVRAHAAGRDEAGVRRGHKIGLMLETSPRFSCSNTQRSGSVR